MKHPHGDKLMELIAKAADVDSRTVSRIVKELVKSDITK